MWICVISHRQHASAVIGLFTYLREASALLVPLIRAIPGPLTVGAGNKYGSHVFFVPRISSVLGAHRHHYRTMRKFYILLLATLAFLSSNVASAQTQWWDATKSNGGITLRGEVGLNLSSFIHVERWSGTKVGANFGVMAEKPIFTSLSAKVGVFYTMKGTVGNNDGGFGGNLKTTFSPAYLEIPVLASYRYQLNEGIRLQFDFGPYFAIGLHGKDKKEYSGSDIAHDTNTEINLFTEQLNRLDFGFRFGPEVVFNDKLAVSLEYEVSAVNISKSGKIGNSNFMINVSYPFYTF